MWNNTVRSKIKKQNIKTENPVNKLMQQKPTGNVDFILPGGIGGWTEYGPDTSEITYFTVLRVLSEAVGSWKIDVRDKNNEIVNNAAERILTISPADGITPVSFFSYMEYCRNNYGNSYAYVKWNEVTGELESVTPLNPANVRVWIDDVSNEIALKHYYSYTTPAGNSYFIPSEDVIHVKNWHLADNNLIGIPVKETLRSYLEGAKAGQQMQNELFKSNFLASGVLNYVGDLSEEKKAVLLEQIKKIGTKNKIIPLPADWKLSTLDLSLQDSQYLETRRFTANQIAAAFGVSPNQLNDYSKGSYANATAQQLAFLTNTMLYVSKCYEDELTVKLLREDEIADGLRIDVDEDAMLKTTPDVLGRLLCSYVQNSIMTINEARTRCGLTPLDDGDKLMTMPGAAALEEEKEVIVDA